MNGAAGCWATTVIGCPERDANVYNKHRPALWTCEWICDFCHVSVEIQEDLDFFCLCLQNYFQALDSSPTDYIHMSCGCGVSSSSTSQRSEQSPH